MPVTLWCSEPVTQPANVCLGTGDIALCLHAVQQCGCKIVLRERK